MRAKSWQRGKNLQNLARTSRLFVFGDSLGKKLFPRNDSDARKKKEEKAIVSIESINSAIIGANLIDSVAILLRQLTLELLKQCVVY